MAKRAARKYLAYIILISFFLIISFIFLKNHSQSFYFEDESEHLAQAYLLFAHKLKLYTDLSSNHQPLPILFSLPIIFLFKIFNLSFFKLIDLIRAYMLVLSLFGGIILTWRFGLKGLITTIFIELIKPYFLGHYLLAEPLTAYPTIYLLGNLIEKYYPPNIPPGGMFTRQNLFLITLSIFIIIFSLLPSWPFILLFIFFYFYKTNKKNILFTLNILLILIIFLFLFINPIHYFKETIFNTVQYFIPSETSKHNPLLLPLYSLVATPQLKYPISFYLFITNITLLLSLIKFKLKNLKKISLFYLLILTLNTRVYSSQTLYYTAFHALPFVAALTTLTIFLLFENFKKNNLKIILIILISLITINSHWLFEKKNKEVEHNHQYAEQTAVAKNINDLKKSGDTLFTGPLYGYLHLLTNLPPADRQTAHMDWALKSPPLNSEFENMLENNLPNFIYFKDDGSQYKQRLNDVIDKNYLMSKNNQQLFILK